MFVVCALMSQACGPSEPEETCGDGELTVSEECDDSNSRPGDGCDEVCEQENGYDCPDGLVCDPVCGDGRVVDAEVCDPSAPDFLQYCSSDCTTMIASCGDGVLQTSHEACDDGDPSARDGCTSSCLAGFMWRCDPTGACDASPVDGTIVLGDLADAELTEFCTWMIGGLGGGGRTERCGALIYTVNSVAQCERAVGAFTGRIAECTVEQFEGWAAERSGACDFFESTVPTC